MQSEYEFNRRQNQKFSKLAGAMQFVGVAQMVMAALSVLGAVMQDNTIQAVNSIVSAGVFVLIGLWTLKAAKEVKKIVKTTGSDISHLMSAVEELGSLYNFQRILIIIAIVVLGVLLAGVTVLGVVGSAV